MRPVWLVLLAACWTQPPPPQAPAVENSAPAESAPAPADEIRRSEWRGTYTCAQGLTALHLTLEQRCAAAGCQVGGVFEFGPVAENPSVAHGSYHVIGEISPGPGGEAVLTLRPDAWIDQPPGYIMVGLTATTDHDQRLLHGQIDDTACGELSLDRVQ